MDKNLNSTILDAARLSGTSDYMQAIPAASQGSVSAVIEAFNEPNAGRYFNEITGLFNTIGMNRIKARRWENPLEFLEGSSLNYGHSIREIAVKWAEAHSFDSEAQSLLRRNLPKFVEAFHSLDRFDRYDTSISRTEFLQSLTPEINGDGYGLDTLLGAIFDSIYSPEAYDSMRYTLQVMAEADMRWNDGRGLMRVHVDEITDKDSGEDFMAKVEELALEWKFPSTIYNNVDGLPVWTENQDLVLLCTPKVLSKIDFKTIANLFHEERAEDVRRRVVLVPDFPIPNVEAVLADRSFWVINRSVFQLESFYNPQQMVTNYYLQSQGVWSASPLANIVLLGQFEDTEIPTVTLSTEGLEMTPVKTEVELGGSVQIRSSITATIDGATPESGITQEPDSVIYSVEVSAGTLNRNTFVDRFGVLHVQKTGIEAGATITVTGKSTYINPSGETPELTATCTVTVVERKTADTDNTEQEQVAYTDIREAELTDTSVGIEGGE